MGDSPKPLFVTLAQRKQTTQTPRLDEPPDGFPGLQSSGSMGLTPHLAGLMAPPPSMAFFPTSEQSMPRCRTRTCSASRLPSKQLCVRKCEREASYVGAGQHVTDIRLHAGPQFYYGPMPVPPTPGMVNPYFLSMGSGPLPVNSSPLMDRGGSLVSIPSGPYRGAAPSHVPC